MDTLDLLLDERALMRLKARYFRCMDSKDWTGYRAVFTDDASLDVRGENHGGEIGEAGLVRGGDAIVAFVSRQLAGVTTVHHGHMAEIERLDVNHAIGIWAMEDLLIWPPASPLRRVHGYGHYHDTYRREADGWRIASTRLTRCHVDVERA